VVVLLAGVARAEPPAVPKPAKVNRVARPPLGTAPAGARLGFVLYDVDKDEMTVVDPAQVETRFVPASTYKIPNALIGLETGVVTGEDFTLSWDGVKRDRESWNQDHNLATAIKESAVWYFQIVARRVGLARMQEKVKAFGYGNQNIGVVVDRFWLDGPLAISALEQVEFLRRLLATARGQKVPWALPVSPGHAQLLMKLLVKRESGGWVLRGKTGMARARKPQRIGWLVGIVDAPNGKGSWVYATIVTGKDSAGPAIFDARETLTIGMLAELGVSFPIPAP
jgi:beta-lactamase class D